MTSSARAVLIAISLASTLLSAQAAPAAHEAVGSSDNAKITARDRLREMKSFEQYVAYWTMEPGWSTELQLRNNLESSKRKFRSRPKIGR